MEYSQDELKHPEWMNKSFFEDILQKYEKGPKLTVSSITVKPATKPGDHFASIMFRVTINYTRNSKVIYTKSVVVKTKPFIASMKMEFLDESPIFETEMRMYRKTIPEMHRLLRSFGDTTQFGPELIYCSEEPAPVLVFEDLADKQLTTSKGQFDLKRSEMVMEILAKWHACSYFMKADRNFMDEFETYNKNMFNGAAGSFAINMIDTNFKIVLDVMKSWEGFKDISVKYEKFTKDWKEIGEKAYRENNDNEGYNILNHGDFHEKNLMVHRTTDGEIDKMLVVDFQLSSYSSPALDIGTAIYGACNRETRDNHRDDLILLYHQTFADTLKNLKFKEQIPTLVDLQIEIIKHGYFEMLAVAFAPFIYMDFTKISPEDIFDVKSEKYSKVITDVYSRDDVAQMLKKYLKKFYSIGYF